MVWYVIVMALVVALAEAQIRYEDGVVNDAEFQAAVASGPGVQQPIFIRTPSASPPTIISGPTIRQPVSVPQIPPRALPLPSFTPQPAVPVAVPPQSFLPTFPGCPYTGVPNIHYYNQGSYYHVSWCHHSGSFNYQQASDYCRNLPWVLRGLTFDLLRINDVSELSFIYEILNSFGVSLSVWTKDSYYTAAYDIRQHIRRAVGNPSADYYISVEVQNLYGQLQNFLSEEHASSYKLLICKA